MVIDPPPPEDVFKEKYFEVIAKLVSLGEKRHDIVKEALELSVLFYVLFYVTLCPF